MERQRIPRVILQSLIWVAVWALVFLILGGGFEAPWHFLRRLLPLLFTVGVVVFINEALLLPRLYFATDRRWGSGRGRGYYVIAAIAIVVGGALLLQYGWEADRRFPIELGRGPRPRGLGTATLRFLLPLITALMGSTLLAVARHANRQERQMIRAEREQLTTELKFLKSQINPHFLFNSLNNIYTLTLLNDDRAAESLLRLSGMLRYMLYEAESPTVPLGREVEYLQDFIRLMALKDSRGLNVTLDVDDHRPDSRIAPLLLLPFAENAYKHSRIEDLDLGHIHVGLVTDVDGLTYTVTNSLPATPGPVDAVGGIGLENVRKRLELLYPGRHTLDIVRSSDTFRVTLQLKLP